MDNAIAVMTTEQLREFAAVVARETIAALNHEAVTADNDLTAGKRYVYGLQGIKDLFNVSQPTACKYKRTFLRPAVIQRGRKIIVDAEKAIELFNAYQEEYGNEKRI